MSPSGTTVGPSTPESDGGPPMPTGGGVPPAVRNRARSVTVWNSSVSADLVVRRHVERDHRGGRRAASGRMPAWCLPWNGTAGSRPVTAAALAAAAGSAGVPRP